jgi:ubiquinone/menaquinone biosynthesis C-methylase UbiE
VKIWGVGNVALIDGDATQMPFPDRSFDLIVSNLGLNNFDDPVTAMAEYRRVARPGALLALATNLQGTMAKLTSSILLGTSAQLYHSFVKNSID